MWERILDHLLRRLIRDGNFSLQMPDGAWHRYGDGTGAEVRVTLHDPALPGRLVRAPDMALGDAYMDQSLTVENDDLSGFLALLLRNAAGGRADWWRYPLERVQRVVRMVGQISPASRAKRNVAHHYDLSGGLYDLFLDADRQYSCGYFKTPEDSLEQAQAQKKAHIGAKLLLQPGMRVLDIGCGWGGMALTLARDHGVKVLGITLSQEQHRMATRRAAEAGLSDRVEFRLTDYRAVTGPFDRIVSVGMFEHVGVPQYRTYFRQVHDLLAPDGVALIHSIGRVSPPGITSPWITKYIFPGGYCPALSEVMPALEQSGLWTNDIEVWRLHYAETLRHWQQRFTANIDAATALYDARFCRMWRYYLVASEMTFRHYQQCVFQLQISHRQDVVPLTRDYLYPATAPA
ncbi:MAG: cyclopropane-fatty-acyl-phospholipid synthase family protein [Pseudorhodobacter sp.]|nr:cyclopropane-fatty-acyl-phospholipid synthase family protein [Pseudorhodobacter sp.]